MKKQRKFNISIGVKNCGITSISILSIMQMAEIGLDIWGEMEQFLIV